ncbi:MAG: type IX secretion system sortase PorU [Bacteroidota bacterium]|nr:type IX secretion system sortase PorU [Bacteroidota bacterium]
MNYTNLPMFISRKMVSLCVLQCLFFVAAAQRVYKPSSVLATGNWYKISIAADGVYKLDIPFLSSLGINGSIPSAQMRIFGGGGGMLAEANNTVRIDDLEEIAITVEDGGDGLLNGGDYILFYARGPDQWIKDSVNKRLSHKKNLYSDKAFYFINIGGTGKRIGTQVSPPSASVNVNSFDERFFHEMDSVNFLSSGKEWYGEEFSAIPGRTLTRNFALPFSDLLSGQAKIVTSVAGRSVNTGSRFTVQLNNQQVQQLDVSSISTAQFEPFAQPVQKEDNGIINQSTATVSFTYTPGSVNSQGWLNWFEFFCRRSLAIPANKQLLFRDWNSLNNASVQFFLSGADASTIVWDVSDPFQPVKMKSSGAGNSLSFINDAMQLREYVAFSTSLPVPKAEGRVETQNLHATSAADYLVVTPPQFITQAQRLANFHLQRNKLTTVIATTDQIFNEFSGGIPDPTAIRDFAKMYFDKYAGASSKKLKYLLLFGKASFDYKNRIVNNTNLVPCYESVASLEPLSTYTSDDFFGFLDDAEDINSSVILNTLDLGIGRIPARNVVEAKAFVDKIIDYHAAAAFGPWRNNLNFIADDEDMNLHLQDAEVLTSTVSSIAPVFNQQKIYLDAFQQESGSSGGRYPQANVVINSNIDNGTLIWNYSGHGGPERLAEEVVIDQNIVSNWNNQYKLPLFITATCDFAPYDNPLQPSLGENLITRPKTGAIALMTTTRVVFANSNRIINNNYLKVALQPDATGHYKSLGEAVQFSKNLTYTTSGDIINNRKFALLGDPAMTLSFPTLRVAATMVNGRSMATQTDTLRATEFAIIDGEVQDFSGSLQSNFNGTVYLSLFDKVKAITTLGNDATSIPVAFPDQSNLLFKGKASANSGRFSFKFRLPKDINFQYGAGKISLYAQDEVKDGNGYSTNIIIGGIAQGVNTDNVGPEIKAYLNDERFVNGSITNAAPLLLLQLSDSSGINTGSSGIDHDIVATLDGNNNQFYILNSFYESDLNNYQKGMVRFQLPLLTPGSHSLKIKAWDVVNNSSEYLLNFTVINKEELRLDHVLNYPNPFTTNTAFWFEHNYPGVDLAAKVDIFTVSGRRIKTLTKTINTPGNRSTELNWDGTDEWGAKVGRGVYIYHLFIKTPNGKWAGKWERLVILN